jgi:hypothetical protein
MMGGPKAGAEFGASATAKRAGAGTIGETAAIARRNAAEGGEDAPAASFAAAAEPTPDPTWNRGSSASTPTKPETVSATETVKPHDGIQLRRSRAGAGLMKEVTAPDNSATHLILAERAYAYGQHIVRKDEGQKPGDVLAIVS